MAKPNQERKARNAINEVVTREYTIHVHKRIRGIGAKKRAPRAIDEIRKFAKAQMNTEDVRIDTRLNKFIWSKGIKNVPFRVRVRLSRRHNEDEDSAHKLYTLATYVPCTSFKGLTNVNVDSEDHILLENEGVRLAFKKCDGRCEQFPSTEVIPDAVLCGTFQLFVGRLEIDNVYYLLLVSQSTRVGYFRNHDKKIPIYKIEKVKAVPIDVDERNLKHLLEENQGGKLKVGTEKLLKFVQEKIGNQPTFLEEILKLFNDNPDFYYCLERDITRSTERFFGSSSEPIECFFWNKHLLSCIDDSFSPEFKDKWTIPVIQGFIRTVEITLQEDAQLTASLEVTLISRRSVRRAGARYLRRGIDNDGNVANFVESELILNIFGHHLSYVQIRGSVPLFWSQKGLKYRPPLSIDKSTEESLPVFEKHISELVSIYGSNLILVNLVDLTGRELKLALGYLEHALKQKSEKIVFASFDLHKHCRGLRFDRISILIDSIQDQLNEVGFCWVDKTGEIVQSQKGVVRTNCVDCLDRTNVVQGSISQFVCMRQAQRLGIFGPLAEPPDILVNVLQTLWADNGDAISTQYAGTAALKGDVTRSGERKIAGIMKDGYNSASRYYLSHVRDSTRQKAINHLLGEPDLGSESMVDDSDEDEDGNVSRLVSETIHFLLPEGEVLVAGWGLVDARDDSDNVDSVVLLTRARLFVALYDDEVEKLMDVRIIPLDEIETIEVGKPSRNARTHLRITGKNGSQGSWAWRPSKTRLFNNVAIRIKSAEEADEYAESIAEQISVAYEMSRGEVKPIQKPCKLVLNGPGAARKALASMTSALKFKPKRPNSSPGPIDVPTKCEDSNSSTPKDEDRSAETSESEQNDNDKVTGLVGRIRGLRPIFVKQKQDTIDPFESLKPIMCNELTKLILL
ncbi:unnamed protein product [Auanema sp. JU1783]|nr:unnamed protein product [Auanema sp. JU1783]